MYIIQNLEEYQDFQAFMKDPSVKVISEQGNDEKTIYTFNTNETIVVPNEFLKSSSNDLDDLIFGKDKTKGIVNISIHEDTAELYFNDGSVEVKSYKPWTLSHYPNGAGAKRLKGNQYYKYISYSSLEDYLEQERNFNRSIWRPRKIEEGYLLLNGASYYKGMKLEDLSLLSFDIETSGFEHNDSSIVFMISNTFRKGTTKVKKLFIIDDYNSVEEMIEAWCIWVQEIDPSVLIGHNIFAFDLPYLNYCSGGKLNLGRDGSIVKFSDKVERFRKDGSQQYDYYNARIVGREIVDTFFLCMKYDVAREFPSYGLKPVIKYLGKEKPGRQYYDASKIKENWKIPEEKKKIIQYGDEDSDDPIVIFDIMAPSYFYLAQSMPKTFQQMINEATGSQLDAFMIRAYLQDGYSQPKSDESHPFEGAISMGIPGIYDNVMKADVASLYPSIMLQYDIYDKRKDPDRKMLKALEYFRTQRLMNKKLAKETKDKYYDDLQNSMKISINSLYGFLGAGYLLYNYPAGAERVTKHGREILLKAVQWATGHTLKKVVKDIRNKGKVNEEISYEWVLGDKVCEGNDHVLVNVDTDSFSSTKNRPISTEQFESEINSLNSIYPDLIKWEDDGIYDKVIVVKAKNYVLKQGNKVKFKGSSIKDQKKEKALREMMEEIFNALLDDKKDFVKNIYEKFKTEAQNIIDINRWTVKKTITKAILESDRLNESKVRDALVGVNIQEGDKIWIYNAIDGEIQAVVKGEPKFYKKTGLPKMIPNKVLKTPEKWNKDEDKDHYVDRVRDTIEILESIIDLKDYE